MIKISAKYLRSASSGQMAGKQNPTTVEGGLYNYYSLIVIFPEWYTAAKYCAKMAWHFARVELAGKCA